MGEKARAAARACRTDREPDQRRPESADPAVVGGDRKARAPPQAGTFFMDAYRAHHRVSGDSQHGEGDDRRCDLIDPVAIVIHEYALLLTEDGAAQGHGAVPFPRLGGVFDEVFAGDEGR
jgi:hypothetical protein